MNRPSTKFPDIDTRVREFAFTNADFQALRSLVKEMTGINLAESKQELVYGRVSRRLRALGMASFGSYRELLESGDGSELVAFCNALTTNLTAFFRESHHFDYLRNEFLVPRRGVPQSKRIRIWSSACSSGEEPYSIAMTVIESIPDWQKWDIKILATDLDSDILARAQRGCYNAERVKGLGPKRLGQFFEQTRDGAETVYQVTPRAAEAHHVQADQSHARSADVGTARCDLLPQRRHLFRQGDAARSVLAYRQIAAARRPVVPGALGDALQGFQRLLVDRQNHLQAWVMLAPGSNQARAEPPPAAKGFEHVKRYWDPACARWSAKILPGEYFVTRNDEAITTVLGSCISACMRDPSLRIGGMNHFMLPADNSTGKSSWIEGPGGLATRYGSYAMESLINELMKLGARRDRMEVKLFGGGKILSSMTDVGKKNIEFAKGFLSLEGFRIAAEDVGDMCPRRVVYFPTTGVVMLKRLRALDVVEIAQRETNYMTSLTNKKSDDDVELFD